MIDYDNGCDILGVDHLRCEDISHRILLFFNQLLESSVQDAATLGEFSILSLLSPKKLLQKIFIDCKQHSKHSILLANIVKQFPWLLTFDFEHNNPKMNSSSFWKMVYHECNQPHLQMNEARNISIFIQTVVENMEEKEIVDKIENNCRNDGVIVCLALNVFLIPSFTINFNHFQKLFFNHEKSDIIDDGKQTESDSTNVRTFIMKMDIFLENTSNIFLQHSIFMDDELQERLLNLSVETLILFISYIRNRYPLSNEISFKSFVYIFFFFHASFSWCMCSFQQNC